MGISIIYEGFAVEPKNVTEYGFCHRHSILSQITFRNRCSLAHNCRVSSYLVLMLCKICVPTNCSMLEFI